MISISFDNVLLIRGINLLSILIINLSTLLMKSGINVENKSSSPKHCSAHSKTRPLFSGDHSGFVELISIPILLFKQIFRSYESY